MIDNKKDIYIRLKLARLKLNIPSGEFAKKAGIDPRNYSSIESGKRTVGEKVLKDICATYPINMVWLLTGQGEMLKSEKPVQNSMEDGGFTEGKLIPLYDADSAAGIAYNMSMTPAKQIEMIQIGGFLKESEAALRVYGNSMIPHYPPGCIVATKRWNEHFIEPGQVYVVETSENRYLKRLLYNKDKTAYRCLSDNTMRYDSGAAEGELCYPEFEIPIEDVRRIFRVVGVIKRNII